MRGFRGTYESRNPHRRTQVSVRACRSVGESAAHPPSSALRRTDRRECRSCNRDSGPRRSQADRRARTARWRASCTPAAPGTPSTSDRHRYRSGGSVARSMPFRDRSIAEGGPVLQTTARAIPCCSLVRFQQPEMQNHNANHRLARAFIPRAQRDDCVSVGNVARSRRARKGTAHSVAGHHEACCKH